MIKPELNLNEIAENRPVLRSIVFGLIRENFNNKNNASWWRFSITPHWKEYAGRMTRENQIRFELEYRYTYKLPFVAKNDDMIAIAKFNNPALLAYACALYTWMQLHFDETGDKGLVDLRTPDNALHRYTPNTRPRLEHYGVTGAEESETFVEKHCVDLLDAKLSDEAHCANIWSQPDKRDDPKTVHIRPYKDRDLRDIINLIQIGLWPHTGITNRKTGDIIQPVNNAAIAGAIIGSNDGRTIYQRGEHGNLINLTKRRGKHQPDKS